MDFLRRGDENQRVRSAPPERALRPYALDPLDNVDLVLEVAVDAGEGVVPAHQLPREVHHHAEVLDRVEKGVDLRDAPVAHVELPRVTAPHDELAVLDDGVVPGVGLVSRDQDQEAPLSRLVIIDPA